MRTGWRGSVCEEREVCCERFDDSNVCLMTPLFGDIPVVCTDLDDVCRVVVW